MNDLLAEIVAAKRKEIHKLQESREELERADPPTPVRDFKSVLSGSGGIKLIAEIKFASPSAGMIRETTDPIEIGLLYEDAGASAISLLTDKGFFQGDLKHLPRLKKAVNLPILRKDFIVDEIQVKESFVFGADAILLIAGILSKQQLRGLLVTCRGLGMTALTEIHDRDELEKAIECGADIIGINNRNLKTFEVSLSTTAELAPLVGDEYVVVSESGIRSGEDVRFLMAYGVRAILVGTSIMKSDGMRAKIRELVEAGEGGSDQ